MRLNLPFGGQSVKATSERLVVLSYSALQVLSSAVLNGGLRKANSILIQRVPSNFRCADPQAYLSKIAAKHRLDLGTTVGFMTAANPRKFGFSTFEHGRIRVSAIVTAGTSNAARAGEHVKLSKSGTGTVNIIVLTDARMTERCLANALQTATEAKTLSFRELDIRSANSREEATGTSTDAILIGTTNESETCEYAGVASDLGRSIAKTVHDSVREAIIRHDRLLPNRHLLDRLRERGIKLKDLEDAFLQNYLHHESFGTRDRAMKIFRRSLEEASSDHNVAALVLAALRLEDDGRLGLIPGLSEGEFAKDPVSLLADEIMGMAISNYIAGSKGLFEYVRFDRTKPGVIRKLGPFADDAIGALVAGASSNVYSRLLRKE